jgi:hypothetical protein
MINLINKIGIWTLLVFIFDVSLLHSQIIDSCGIDSVSILNNYESEYLNNYFEEQRDTFNFVNKKIVFVTGSSGSKIGNKKEYFDSIKRWKKEHNSRISTSLIILSNEEKKKSGGFDAIIIYWVKIFTDGRKNKIIKQLKNST